MGTSKNTFRQKDISLLGGVLIIGSLLWDKEQQRENWRNNFLLVNEGISVPAPIRYGRVSTERNCTFSMVFSDECNTVDCLGKAVFVPFNNNPINFEGLDLQTTELIKSERKLNSLDSDKFNWAWGTLTLSINPETLKGTSEKGIQAKLLLAYWARKYSGGFKPEQYKVGNEQPVVNKQGLIKFNWPEDLNEYDFIIATATKPERVSYPTPKNIADRMIANEYSEYFYRNLEYRISTFQDAEILGFMNSE